MLSSQAFEQWCQCLNLSEQARMLIAHIRSSPPSRLVRSAAGNVSGRYPSQKMQCTIQFESHRDELAAIYFMEHDPEVVEFYDQPGKIKLTYPGPKKQVSVWHTPDFFVLHSNAAGWVECKMEENLIRLSQEQPHRYRHHSDGSWSCPPGKTYAQSLGLFYRLRSSRETDWVHLRNLRFLEEYLRGPHFMPSTEMTEAIRRAVMRQPGMSLLELLQNFSTKHADAIYFLIAADQLSVDLSQAGLAEPERVQVFPDRETARASIALSSHSAPVPSPSLFSLAVGAVLWWDGNCWTVLNPGETEVTLLSENKHVKALPRDAFERLLREGKITGILPQAENQEPGAARVLLEQASPKHLEIALRRYQALSNPAGTRVPARTLRRWHARFQQAAACYGNGYVGLLPDWNHCGDRTPRLANQTEALLETFILERYETLKQQPKREVYLLLEQEAERQQIPIPSYSTFLRRIAQRPRTQVISKRQGPRAAAQQEPFYWELEQTTPKHGERPWDIAHVDHTELDVELVSARTGRSLGRPWATFLIDAFSRRLLVVYVTFDPPSYRSCLMTLRECVARYGRLPQTLVVDGGSDFRSTYFETLLAYYRCTKVTRPWAKPRYGSVIERLFGTANTQFIHNLMGNTQIMKQVRQVTKAVDPKHQAVWTLGDLYRYLTDWAYQVYDLEMHPALGMTPQEAFQMGLTLGGERAHYLILPNDEFCFLSLASTRKGTAKVEPGHGVKVHYVYYWSEAFLSPAVERIQVPVRYDPFDIGVAYAYVQGQWVQCHSEHYLQLRGHTERERQIASAELHKQDQNHPKEAAITAKRLATFLASAEAHEQVLLQRLHDLEARDVFAQMGSSHMLQETQESNESASPSSFSSDHHHQTVPRLELEDHDTPEALLEKLDEYEEYH